MRHQNAPAANSGHRAAFQNPDSDVLGEWVVRYPQLQEQSVSAEGVNFSLPRLKYLLPTTDFNILRLDLLVQTSQH